VQCIERAFAARGKVVDRGKQDFLHPSPIGRRRNTGERKARKWSGQLSFSRVMA
jgi:hypothetical protein